MGWERKEAEWPLGVSVSGLGGRVGDAQRQAGQTPASVVWTLDEQTLCVVHTPGWVLRGFSPVSLPVLTWTRRSTDFTDAAGAGRGTALRPRPDPAPGPGGVPCSPRAPRVSGPAE